MFDSRLSAVSVDAPLDLRDACTEVLCDQLAELTEPWFAEDVTATPLRPVKQAKEGDDASTAQTKGNDGAEKKSNGASTEEVDNDADRQKNGEAGSGGVPMEEGEPSTSAAAATAAATAALPCTSATPEETPSPSSAAASVTPDEKDLLVVLRFKNAPQHFFLPQHISEAFLTRLSERKLLTDQTLSLFRPENTRLSHVKIRDAAQVTAAGLRVLRGHSVKELEAHGMTQATVTELLRCLSYDTTINLKLLNVAHSTFVDKQRNTVMVALSRLQSLITLNVSWTEFNRSNLEMVIDDLPNLQVLDISNTKVNDILCLRKAKGRLRHLAAYNLQISSAHEQDMEEVLMDLKELRFLDVSEDPEANAPATNMLPASSGRLRVNNLLTMDGCLPNLISLDISGKDDVNINDLIKFVDARPSIAYLGLTLTEHCKNDAFTDKAINPRCEKLTLTGSANEKQVLEALRRYIDRPHYTQKSLYYLFRLTQGYTTPRPDIIKAVITSAYRYPTVFPIQMAATACLYNLSKSEIGTKLHPSVLRQIVEVDLCAMKEFKQHQQLQKNVLLTICSDRILQDVNFNRFLCAKLVLDCLCNFEDHSMNRMSVAICSILAAKISTAETSELGSHPNYMEKLLQIVRNRMDITHIDITLKFTLSALWNLTDESPQTCEMFLNLGGLKLFLQVLETFPGEMAIETKVLGLLNNIAEVPELRSNLLVDPFITLLIKLMHSKHIDVSYFAAGIVAHLASDCSEKWMDMFVPKGEILNDLCHVVLNWKTPKEGMVAYRSFRPFFPLIECSQPYAVQLWAVWAINHVCAKNAERYCPMLIEQGGRPRILDLLRNPVTHNSVVDLCQSVVETLKSVGLIDEETIKENNRIMQEANLDL